MLAAPKHPKRASPEDGKAGFGHNVINNPLSTLPSINLVFNSMDLNYSILTIPTISYFLLSIFYAILFYFPSLFCLFMMSAVFTRHGWPTN